MKAAAAKPGAEAVDRLLDCSPFSLDEASKASFFGPAMAESFRHHFENNEFFRTWCRKLGFSPEKEISELAEYPYLPAAAFKKRNLISVPAAKIRSEVRSSATAGAPSVISVDLITSKRQSRASARVIAEYLGHHRRPFIILDRDPASSGSREISARSAAARGFLVFADSIEYVLEESGSGVRLDEARLRAALTDHERSGREVWIFGFTFILHELVIRRLEEAKLSFHLAGRAGIAHIGGWKKLEEKRVTRRRFLEDCGRVLGIREQDIVDFYGFTEQMGLVYAGRGGSPKTVSAYSEVIIRDPNSLRPAKDGEWGLVQFLTPLPHSYPGISVLTDDIGRVVGRGRDEEGRWGTRFEVLGRGEKAEARGCGDLFQV